jgi:hypothetical protein
MEAEEAKRDKGMTVPTGRTTLIERKSHMPRVVAVQAAAMAPLS